MATLMKDISKMDCITAMANKFLKMGMSILVNSVTDSDMVKEFLSLLMEIITTESGKMITKTAMVS